MVIEGAAEWAVVIVAYTAAGALWSDLLSLDGKPTLTPEGEDRSKQRDARRTRRVWIWQAGLFLIMIAWWVSTHSVSVPG
jgi:hypothetical protein